MSPPPPGCAPSNGNAGDRARVIAAGATPDALSDTQPDVQTEISAASANFPIPINEDREVGKENTRVVKV